ncbi:MAG TPA: hypothetical protein VJC11_01965 [Patescibacteria group bacterium]|nr:hypothetical protein [Patescibacteria group bacterium]
MENIALYYFVDQPFSKTTREDFSKPDQTGHGPEERQMRQTVFAVVLIAMCAGCSAMNAANVREEFPRPDWTDKDVWFEGKKIYAVAFEPKSPAGLDVQMRSAELNAREKIVRELDVCRITLIGYAWLKQWIDISDGTVYALVRVDDYIPWKKCDD